MNFEKLQQILGLYDTVVYFSDLAMRDFKSFSIGKRNQILMLILKQAQKGADLKPNGNGNQLRPPLHQFAKIKSKSLSLRIIYRPVRNVNIVEIQVLVIGPRDKNKVYELADKRLESFFVEVSEREK